MVVAPKAILTRMKSRLLPRLMGGWRCRVQICSDHGVDIAYDDSRVNGRLRKTCPACDEVATLRANFEASQVDFEASQDEVATLRAHVEELQEELAGLKTT